MKSPLLLLLASMLATLRISATPVEPHPGGLELTPLAGSPGVYKISWQAQPGYTYFVQTSLNLAGHSWEYAPFIEYGTGTPSETIEWCLCNTDKQLWARLVYTDLPVPGGNPELADFDGDGLTNLAEVTIHGTNPFSDDNDGDGLTDAQEMAAGTNPRHFDMPELRVMATWRDAQIEDWRGDVTSSPNNLQWPVYSGREVKAVATNTSSESDPANPLNKRTDWLPISRNSVLAQLPNINPSDATSKLWNDLTGPAQPPSAFSWGVPVEIGTTFGAWMMQSFSYVSPYKIHTIRARAIKVFLKASRPMPIEFRCKFVVRKSTRTGTSTSYSTPVTVSTHFLTISTGSTQSLSFERNPAADVEAWPPAMSPSAPHTVNEVYYSINAEPYPYHTNPLPTGDSDLDGFPDANESTYGSDPLSSDTDADGRPDLFDFLPPAAIVTVTGAAPSTPLEPEVPTIEYIYRDGHICPIWQLTGASSSANVAVQNTHWSRGQKTTNLSTPPPAPITAIEQAWSQDALMSVLSFPNNNVPPAIPYTGVPYGMVDRRFTSWQRPNAIFTLRSYSIVRSYQYNNPPTSGLGGDASAAKVRLRRSVAGPQYAERRFLLLDRQKSDTTAAGWVVNSQNEVVLTIPANELYSEVYDLAVPSAVTPPASKASLHEKLLLPIEVRITQAPVLGPHGSPAMYATAQPTDGQAPGDLFSLWANEEAKFMISEPLSGMLANGQFPTGYIKWNTPMLAPKTDVRDFTVKWSATGSHVVRLDIGPLWYSLRVNVPETGTYDLDRDLTTGDPLQVLVGTVRMGQMLTTGFLTRNFVATRYGQDGGNGGTKQDAVRHSTWNAMCAQQWGKPTTILVTTANEYHGRFSEKAFSSNTTMDLRNNDTGATYGHTLFGTSPLKTAFEMIDQMDTLFITGDLWAWTPPNANVVSHSHVVRLSTQYKIYPP